MRPQNGAVLSLGAYLWATLVGVGCTFPSVDYEDRPSMTNSTQVMPCAVPQACMNSVTTCAAKVQVKSDSCVSKCSGGQSSACIKCTDAVTAAIATCLNECDTCSANNGCPNATDSCNTYIIPP